MAWTAGDFLDGLATQLAARAGIQALTPAVRVVTYWPSADESITDAIILGHTVRDVHDPAALGQQRYREEVTVDCTIRVIRPGAGETQAAAARQRAEALMAEIDDELKTPPTVGAQTVAARTSVREMVQFPTTVGTAAARVVMVEFTIDYETRVTS